MKKPLLITIPFSHYCDKARWGLDHAGVAFDEAAHLPAFHAVAVRRAGGKRTVPTLVTGEGVLGDSTDILRWADRRAPADRRLYGESPAEEREIAALEDFFDDKLGPDTRRWGYFHVLASTDRMMRLCDDRRVPRWQQRLFPVIFPVIRPVMRRAMNVTAEGARRSLDRIQIAFDRVTAQLANGREYLVGSRPSAADITFASLAAPVLGPKEHDSTYPEPEDLPAEAAGVLRGLRAHPAALLALRMYREHRRR